MSDAKSPADLSMDEILATIRRIIADEEQPAGAAADPVGAATAPPPAEPPGDDDVLELTEALNEDGSVRHLAPIGSAAQRPAPPPDPGAPPEPAAADEGVVSEVAALAAPPPEPVAPPAPAAADEGVISEVATLAAAAAFARLAELPRGRGAGPEAPRIGDKTLEELVAALLRPLLQAWLDDNLPQLVERLVQAELARVVQRSGVG
jgi:uncharacterized protein